jgi:hypothetical protein
MSKSEKPFAGEVKTAEKEEPFVEVATLFFRDPYDGWGIQGAVSHLNSRAARRESKHTIKWFPRLRVFEVTHHPRDQEFVEIDMVPEAAVKRWRRVSDQINK